MAEARESARAALRDIELPDLAPALAEFFLSDEARVFRDPDALHGACVARWPAVTADEIHRGIAMARDTLRAEPREDSPCPNFQPT